MTEVAPGWYKDPVDQEVQRYWDGEGWVGEPIPADAPAPAGPPKSTAPTIKPPSQPAPPTQPARPTPPVEPPPIEPPVVEPPVGSAPFGMPPVGSPPFGRPPVGAGAPPPSQPGAAWPPGVPPLPPGMVLPPGAIPLPPGTPVPPGLFPGDKLPPGAIPVLLPGRPVPTLVSIVPAAVAHGLPIAPMWSRLLARLIDICAVLALNIVVNGWFVYQYWQEIYPEVSAAFRASMAGEKVEPLASSARLSYLEIVIIVLAAALWFAYEVPAIAGSGQTLGKRVMRVKVMRQESTDAIGFGRAIRRWNPLGLPTLLWYCGIGFILQIIDCLSPVFDWPLRRAFHDRSAATVVVRIPRVEEPADEPVKSGETNDSVNSR